MKGSETARRCHCKQLLFRRAGRQRDMGDRGRTYGDGARLIQGRSGDKD